jgi:hypothetical protein
MVLILNKIDNFDYAQFPLGCLFNNLENTKLDSSYMHFLFKFLMFMKKLNFIVEFLM